MSKIALYIFLIISFIANSVACQAKSMELKDIRPLIDEIEKESGDVVGGAIAIIQNDKIIYKKSFGYKEINGSPVDDNTLFGVASVSKAITATAIGALTDKKLASFEDAVVTNGVHLKLKNVLSHTTGYKIRGDSEIERGATRETLLSLLKREKKPQSKTNQQYSYSNIVYSLTQDYAESKGYKMNELLSLLNSSSYVLPLDSNNLASPHSAERERMSFPSNYQKAVPASAGTFSSLNGMVEFLNVILGNRPSVISKSTLNHIFTPVAKAPDVFGWNILPFRNDEVTSAYCLGWRKLTLKSNSKSSLIFHSGYINGATAFVGLIPGSRVGIVIISNQSSRFPLRNGLKIWKAIVEKDL